MPTDWYATLEVEPTASSVEIRTAYRKKKDAATTNFKEIAEAYEVLGDDRRRWEYDRFEYPLVTGTGMPEDAYDAYSSTSPRGHTFVWESSFDSARRAQQGRPGDGMPRGGFDPFELFNSMFARDFHEMEAMDSSWAGGGMGSSASGGGGARFEDPMGAFRGDGGMPFGFGLGAFGAPSGLGVPPFHASAMDRDLLGGVGGSPFSMLSGFPPTHTSAPAGPSMFTTSSNFSSCGGAGRGASESRRTTLVNGRRETVITKRDAQGNETVRRITPEGETVLVNGQLKTTLEDSRRAAVEDASASAPPLGGASAADEEKETTASPRRRKWKIF
ncbi:hypothetical protein MSPP1_000056 [Malassezia sp. CBS 17886]|nr:hypothetical protein MSPP1_000056 [Malassezia sp. CBS 17886]